MFYLGQKHSIQKLKYSINRSVGLIFYFMINDD